MSVGQILVCLYLIGQKVFKLNILQPMIPERKDKTLLTKNDESKSFKFNIRFNNFKSSSERSLLDRHLQFGNSP